MRSYDLPGGTFGLTAEEAQMAVRKMRADALGDPSHPLLNGNHPQHQDFIKFSSQLTKIIIQDEADQQDALQAEKLSDARAIVGDLLPAESMARGKKLLKTPGFLDGKMPSEERAALQKEIDSLFLVGCQEPEPNPDEMENDNEPGNLEE